MKKGLRIGKFILLGLVGLLAVSVIGLLMYYQTMYQDTPQPPDVVVAPKLNSAPVSEKPVLLPIPKKLTWTNGHFVLPKTIGFKASAEDAETIKNICKNRLNLDAAASASGLLKYTKNPVLQPQAYILKIQPSQIQVEYSDLQGLFYAMTTVKQIAKQSNNQLPCVEIEDSPDLKIRGALLDISRGKVPTLETLYGMVEFLSDLKYNHLELYIEGFSFAYPSFKNIWEKTHTPLTPEEIKQLDAFCKANFIELVPNQNSLGHMEAWLATDEYKDLAECPEGYKMMGLMNVKTTISPTNPKSLELVTKMSDDLLPNFSSDKFNVNLDEPFELGKCKDHPINDPKEVTKIYLDYAKRLNIYVKSKGKKMMMWGDVISKDAAFASQIPKDITLLEWQYESFQDFETNCKKYKDAGLHYLVCPGTSTWTTFTGRTDNMLKNVENAVNNGIKYGAEGMIITDWGNTPHLQYLTVSYAGLAYGAALSWNNAAKSQVNLARYLNNSVFQDKSNKMGDAVLELGRYSQFEEHPMIAGSMTGWAYQFGIMDKTMTDAIFKKIEAGVLDFLTLDEAPKKALTEKFNNAKIYNFKAIIQLAEVYEKELNQTQLQHSEGKLIIDEYKNGIRMVKLGAMLKQFNNYHLQQSDDENRKLLTDMKSLCASIIPEHKRLWMSRNKQGRFEESVASFERLQTQIDTNLAMLDKNGISRWLSRTQEKIMSAATVLYLK